MKGGGLTWAGWLAVGIGSMLVYAGMTGQSLVAELAGVLTGSGLVKGVGPATAGSSGASGLGGAGTVGGGGGGGGGSSWNANTPTKAPAKAAAKAPAYSGGSSSATANGLSGFPPGYVPTPPVSPRVPSYPVWIRP